MLPEGTPPGGLHGQRQSIWDESPTCHRGREGASNHRMKNSNRLIIWCAVKTVRTGCIFRQFNISRMVKRNYRIILPFFPLFSPSPFVLFHCHPFPYPSFSVLPFSSLFLSLHLSSPSRGGEKWMEASTPFSPPHVWRSFSNLTKEFGEPCDLPPDKRFPVRSKLKKLSHETIFSFYLL